jgi:hypothetical protein
VTSFVKPLHSIAAPEETTMLDQFLAVAYGAEQKKTASRQFIDKLKEFPLEELKKLASGDETCKLAYAVDGMKAAGDSDFCWLDKYKGTPLFAKAVELEKQLLQLDMEEQQQREAERAARPQLSDVWAHRDALCLQKRMLDLDLVMSQNGGGEPAAPEAKEEQAIGELEEAQAQEALEGGGGDEAHEQQEDAAIQQLQAAHAGGEEGGAPPQEQPKAPPKPKAPLQQQAQGEGGEDEEDPTKKNDKPKGMSVEVKQSSAKTAGVWEGRSSAGVAPGTNVPVQQAGGNRQGAGAGDDMPTMAAEKMAAVAVNAGAFLAKTAKVLTMNAREHIADKNFAEPKADGPGDTGKYPIPDKAHAKSALGLVGMHGSDAEKSKVRAAVAKKFPGLEKGASDPQGHHIRRAILGNPVSSAIEAAPGSRLDAYGDAWGNAAKHTLGGALTGGAVGGGLGLLGGAGLAALTKDPRAAASLVPAGAALGAGVGGLIGNVRGNHGAEASRIHGARSKHNPPEEKTAGILGTALSAAKPMVSQVGNVLNAGKSLATNAYAKGGLGQVASSFGNVAKQFAQKNPLAAAGIAGAGGLAAGKMLSNSQPQR